MNKEDTLIKLHAYVSSDGMIYTWKSRDMHGKKLRIRRRLRIHFYNGEKTLIDDFISSVRRIYSSKKYITYHPKRFELEVRGQIICKALLSLGDVSSRSWEMPKNMTDKQKSIWIRAFGDCDGTVGYYGYNRYVAIDSMNLRGLKQISGILKKFNIANKIINFKYKGNIYYILKIYGKDNSIKYKRIVGFNHPEKQGKLLNAIKSYKHRNRTI